MTQPSLHLYSCHLIYTLNNIGYLKRTYHYYYHATPGEPCEGSAGVAWYSTQGFKDEEKLRKNDRTVSLFMFMSFPLHWTFYFHLIRKVKADNILNYLRHKGNRQYLLTCKVSRYCILALYARLHTRLLHGANFSFHQLRACLISCTSKYASIHCLTKWFVQ